MSHGQFQTVPVSIFGTFLSVCCARIYIWQALHTQFGAPFECHEYFPMTLTVVQSMTCTGCA
jgi:hypothetical protein